MIGEEEGGGGEMKVEEDEGEVEEEVVGRMGRGYVEER